MKENVTGMGLLLEHDKLQKEELNLLQRLYTMQ